MLITAGLYIASIRFVDVKQCRELFILSLVGLCNVTVAVQEKYFARNIVC